MGASRGENTNGAGLGGGVDELAAEVFPVLVVRSLFDDNLLIVVAELVDDVLVLLGQLKVVEGSYALLGNGGSVWRAKRLMLAGSSFYCMRLMQIDSRPTSRWLLQPQGSRAQSGAAEGRGPEEGEERLRTRTETVRGMNC